MTESNRPPRVRPQVIIAASVLVGIAVMLVLSRFWLDAPAEAPEADASAAALPEPLDPGPPPAAAVEPSDTLPDTTGPEAIADPAIVEAAGPIRIVVLPIRISDPAAETIVESVRRAMLGAMRGMPNVEVVDVGTAELAMVAPANAGALDEDRLAYLAVSRRYDSPNVVEISEQSQAAVGPSWFITARALRANGSSGSGTGISKDGNFGPGSDPESIGVRFAERIVERAGRELVQATPTVAADDQREVIVDSLRPEEQRLQALLRLSADAYDSEVIAAAVDLAARSESAETRARVLGRLRQNVYDATLAQPLSSVLLSDPDAEVRKEAALALAAYAGDAGILPFLEYAQSNDGSAEVRLAARMATMDYDEQQAFKRETLLDRSLTPAERLAPTTISSGPRMMPMVRTFGAEQQEEARAYAEIVAGTDDPELKRRGLLELQQAVGLFPAFRGGWDPDPEIVDVLIDSAGVADESARRAALNVLRGLADNPNVRAVLETVLEDEPELATRARIAEALAESE